MWNSGYFQGERSSKGPATLDAFFFPSYEETRNCCFEALASHQHTAGIFLHNGWIDETSSESVLINDEFVDLNKRVLNGSSRQAEAATRSLKSFDRLSGLPTFSLSNSFEM